MNTQTGQSSEPEGTPAIKESSGTNDIVGPEHSSVESGATKLPSLEESRGTNDIVGPEQSPVGSSASKLTLEESSGTNDIVGPEHSSVESGATKLPSLEKAIELVTKALEEDKNKNYEEALRLYEHAVNYFLIAIKYETHSDKAKKSIREKCVLYLDRSEKIKQYLIQRKSDKTPPKPFQYRTTRNNSSDSEDSEDEKEMKNHLSEVISMEKPSVSWNDVAGLESAKDILKECVILPVKFPHLFKGNRKPYTGILLYGAPGTGKTHLVKALAKEANTSTFLCVQSCDLVSKYLGESEKIVNQLFATARERRPSIIFLDSVDLIFNSSSTPQSERIQREFIAEMRRDTDGIQILAATHIPWTLDSGVLKLFEKRIYIPLPEAAARQEIFISNLDNTPNSLTYNDFQELAKRTEGYSGADICCVVRDALMEPVRLVQLATHYRKVSAPSRNDPNVIVHDLLTPCSPAAIGAIEMNWTSVPADKLLEPICIMDHLLKSLSTSKSSVTENDIKKLEKFRDAFESLK